MHRPGNNRGDPKSSEGAGRSPPGRGLRFPIEGRYCLAAAVALWALGLYKGINLITLLGTLIAVTWCLNLLLAGRRLPLLRWHRRFSAPLFVGRPCGIVVEVTNPTAKDQAGVRLIDRGPAHVLSWFVPRLAPGEKKRLRGEVTLPQRGWYEWPAPTAQSGYPFGLVERTASLGAPERVIVFPAVGRLHRGRLRRFLARAAPSVGRVRRRPTPHPAAQSEFHGLRPFRSGDSPRLIHWRTSARRGELMVREFEETPTDNLVLVLDPTGPGGKRLERAVSLAATICWEWCRQRGDQFVLAVAGPTPTVRSGVTGPDHAADMLRCLAVVQPAEGAGRLADRLNPADLPPGPIIVISAGPTALAEVLPRRLHRPTALLNVAADGRYEFYEPPKVAHAVPDRL